MSERAFERDQVALEISAIIDEFEGDGQDREAECIAKAREAGLDVAGIAKSWREAKAKRKTAPPQAPEVAPTQEVLPPLTLKQRSIAILARQEAAEKEARLK